jgi:hypothetical protein
VFITKAKYTDLDVIPFYTGQAIDIHGHDTRGDHAFHTNRFIV